MPLIIPGHERKRGRRWVAATLAGVVAALAFAPAGLLLFTIKNTIDIQAGRATFRMFYAEGVGSMSPQGLLTVATRNSNGPVYYWRLHLLHGVWIMKLEAR